MSKEKLKILAVGLSDLTECEWMNIKDIVDKSYENKRTSSRLEESDIYEDLISVFVITN